MTISRSVPCHRAGANRGTLFVRYLCCGENSVCAMSNCAIRPPDVDSAQHVLCDDLLVAEASVDPLDDKSSAVGERALEWRSSFAALARCMEMMGKHVMLRLSLRCWPRCFDRGRHRTVEYDPGRDAGAVHFKKSSFSVETGLSTKWSWSGSWRTES